MPNGAHSLQIVQVVPLVRVRSLANRVFDYLVPQEFEGSVQVGALVRVPLGRQVIRGVVVDLGPSQPLPPEELRPIAAVLSDRVPEELVSLAKAIADRFLATLASCLQLVVPPGERVWREGASRVRRFWVMPVTDMLQGETGIRLTKKQKAVVGAVPPEGMPLKEACAVAGVGPAVVRTLVKKGLLELTVQPDQIGTEAQITLQYSTAAAEPSSAWPSLYPEQEEAVCSLLNAYEEPGYSHRLLWGVTGSGKTEIYLHLIARALSEGAGAILLVPEIALTPQIIERVRSRFGAQVGVLHSALSPSQRLREYRRICRGEARIVVGARSAVFAPVRDLRLIIIDESHDQSYKQEEEPRYHAKTVAELRLAARGGLLLEGSATPPVETLVRDTKPVRLSQRASGSQPACEVVDMRRQGGAGLLAPLTRAALAEVLRRQEQAIVLLNRRGYAGYVHCERCGHVMVCQDCELSLTYHISVGQLLCHHCGRSYLEPAVCPSCHEAPLVRSAPGTERLDRELRDLVPLERVFRLDSDVVTSGARVQRVLEDFARSRPGVLVGTQMVAKGHDFPAVTLVVVADADTGLYVPDFRAAERTFQLLTQVAGRAGRANLPGRVLVQTWNPDAPCIRMALARDEAAFYKTELDLRRRLGYPPFAELVRLVAAAKDPRRAEAGARYLVERLGRHLGPTEIRGPARLPSLKGVARWQVIVAARDGSRARRLVGWIVRGLEDAYRQRGVSLTVDVDPQSFL
ncbi:MAG: primosomal protein N' [Thermoleophilia bacterium]|nr:primosomal protein N' [Thermoleophilia bacterium]